MALEDTLVQTFNGDGRASPLGSQAKTFLFGDVVDDLHDRALTVLTDPGNAGAIPVTKSGICGIVTAGAETRTLAIPTFVGQELVLYIDTDGGTCVITVAQAFNATGNNTITMAEVRDSIRLVGITVGGALRWSVLGNDSSALSTV